MRTRTKDAKNSDEEFRFEDEETSQSDKNEKKNFISYKEL